MLELSLILPDITITFSLGDNLEAMKQVATDFHYEDADFSDVLPGRKDMIFAGLGMEWVFMDERLKSVSLYIRAAEHVPFSKACSYLNKAFWATPSPDSFIETLKEQGFESALTKTSHAHAMVKDELKYVYLDSPHQVRVGITRA